jgi:hypothetical protein
MDIKELNKAQLILLSILISFVTSIATGVATFALLQKAPQSVTVPINRIVQRTVEKIVEVQKGQTLSEDDLKLIEDLKALKPLIDKLASEEIKDIDATNVSTEVPKIEEPKDVSKEEVKIETPVNP